MTKICKRAKHFISYAVIKRWAARHDFYGRCREGGDLLRSTFKEAGRIVSAMDADSPLPYLIF